MATAYGAGLNESGYHAATPALHSSFLPAFCSHGASSCGASCAPAQLSFHQACPVFGLLAPACRLSILLFCGWPAHVSSCTVLCQFCPCSSAVARKTLPECNADQGWHGCNDAGHLMPHSTLWVTLSAPLSIPHSLIQSTTHSPTANRHLLKLFCVSLVTYLCISFGVNSSCDW